MHRSSQKKVPLTFHIVMQILAFKFTFQTLNSYVFVVVNSPTQHYHIISVTWNWDGFFWWVFRLLIFLAFSFSVFVWREASKSPTHRILVGDQREKTTLGCGFLSFFLCIWWQFCIVQILSGPKTFLHISSVSICSPHSSAGSSQQSTWLYGNGSYMVILLLQKNPNHSLNFILI